MGDLGVVHRRRVVERARMTLLQRYDIEPAMPHRSTLQYHVPLSAQVSLLSTQVYP